MNEITRIHLGRQPFTISVEAHRALKQYLHDIEKHVADKDVIGEIEMRMAELLMDRGISGDKVVLPDDVEFLKQQLGSPEDFSDSEEARSAPAVQDASTKRLFRDTDTALIAGVASGIANYFGLEAVLVRIIFVILTIFSGGIGIVLYAVLWLAVPPAVTASEKLQMRGKSVTLESLKDSVSKADLQGSAQRARNSALSVVNKLFAVGVKILGIGFVAGGALLLFGLAVAKGYMWLHQGQLFQENFFPIGSREHWLVTVGLLTTAIIAIFLMLVGVASFKRKWPIKGWITGVLAGLFLLGLAASMALAADTAPRVHERYVESMHTTAVKNIQPFNRIETTGGLDVEYVSSPNYSVNFRYYDHPDISKIKVTVVNKTLRVDTSGFDLDRHCTMLCLFPRYNMVVEVSAPNVDNFDLPPRTELFTPDRPDQPVL